MVESLLEKFLGKFGGKSMEETRKKYYNGNGPSGISGEYPGKIILEVILDGVPLGSLKESREDSRVESLDESWEESLEEFRKEYYRVQSLKDIQEEPQQKCKNPGRTS